MKQAIILGGILFLPDTNLRIPWPTWFLGIGSEIYFDITIFSSQQAVLCISTSPDE